MPARKTMFFSLFLPVHALLRTTHHPSQSTALSPMAVKIAGCGFAKLLTDPEYAAIIA